MKRIFTILLFALSISIFSQEKLTNWQLIYSAGSSIKHKQSMGHLVTSHPQNLLLSWAKTSDTTTIWRKRFNYPDTGVTLLYQQFNNEKLGNMTAVSYFTSHYIRNRNAKNQFNIDTGFGLGVADTYFDFEKNNQNNAVSSRFIYNQYFKFNYRRPNIVKGLGLQTGITFTHFSNASFKNPNNGINSVFLNVGLIYQDKKENFDYPAKQKPVFDTLPRHWHWNVSLKTGAHEIYPGLGTKPVISVGTFVNKRIKPMLDMQLGLEFTNSWAAQKQAEFVYYAQYSDKDYIADHKQIGIHAGVEQYFKLLSIDINVGMYLYDPLKLNEMYYERFGVYYNFKKIPFKTGLGLKVHQFKADYVNLDVRYQLM